MGQVHAYWQRSVSAVIDTFGSGRQLCTHTHTHTHTHTLRSQANTRMRAGTSGFWPTIKPRWTPGLVRQHQWRPHIKYARYSLRPTPGGFKAKGVLTRTATPLIVIIMTQEGISTINSAIISGKFRSVDQKSDEPRGASCGSRLLRCCNVCTPHEYASRGQRYFFFFFFFHLSGYMR